MNKAPPIEDDLRILDSRGCLTLEAMCFVDQLEVEQRDVVERHISSCSICAQQRTELIRTQNRLQLARPRIHVPTNMKILVRQVVLRKLDASERRSRKKRRHDSTARIRTLQKAIRVDKWYQLRTFWGISFICLASALVVTLVALIFR